MQLSKQESNTSAPWSCGRVASSKGSMLSHQVLPSLPKILRHFKGLIQWVFSASLELLGPLFSSTL